MPVTANSIDWVDSFLGVGVFGRVPTPWGFTDYGDGLVGRCDNTVGGSTGWSTRTSRRPSPTT